MELLAWQGDVCTKNNLREFYLFFIQYVSGFFYAAGANIDAIGFHRLITYAFMGMDYALGDKYAISLF
jgi:hypothetical protein